MMTTMTMIHPITATTHVGKLWATEETLHAFLNLFRSVAQFAETEKVFNIKVRSMEILRPHSAM